MKWQKMVSASIAVSLVMMFALSLWFRVTSLKTAPDPHADEAYYGVQAAKLIQGRPIANSTASGNILDPFLLLMEAPLVAAFEPSYGLLRVPAVACGILAVVLTFTLGAKVLDRTTALIAAGLLAVLPIAIIFSRIGWEPSQIPLWGALALYFAFRTHRGALVAVHLTAQLVHPSTIMAAPLTVMILLTRQWQTSSAPSSRRWRTLLLTALASAVLIAPIARAKQGSQVARWTYATYHFDHTDWGRYTALFRKMLLGFCMGAPTETSRWSAILFWSVVASVVVLGTWRLFVDRAWERLALVLGTTASWAGLHIAIGPDVLQPGLVRYGLFLVVPAVWSFACLLKSLLIVGETTWAQLARNVQVIGLIGMAFVLLVGMKWNWFDVFIEASKGREKLWTFRTETIEPKHRILDIILTDMERAGTRANPRDRVRALDLPPKVIVAENWWTYRPLQFFLVWHGDFRVASLEFVSHAERERIVREQLNAGAYVVGDVGKEFDRLVRASSPEDSLRTWSVQAGYHPPTAIHRLKRAEEMAEATATSTRGGVTTRR